MKKFFIFILLLVLIACSKEEGGLSNNLPTGNKLINIKENGLKSVYAKIDKTIEKFEYENGTSKLKVTEELSYYISGNLNERNIIEHFISPDETDTYNIKELFLDKDITKETYYFFSYHNFAYHSNYYNDIDNYYYNDNGLFIRRERNYNGVVTSDTRDYEFDELNRPIKLYDYGYSYSTNPETGEEIVEKYLYGYRDIFYNTQGKISQISAYYSPSRDEVFEKSDETFATYYSHGGLKEVKTNYSYGSSEEITSYNQFGDLEKIIYFNNGEVSSIVEYTYFDTYYTIKEIGTNKKRLGETKFVIENNKIIAKVSTYTNYVNFGGEWVEEGKETYQTTVIPR